MVKRQRSQGATAPIPNNEAGNKIGKLMTVKEPFECHHQFRGLRDGVTDAIRKSQPRRHPYGAAPESRAICNTP